jgi:hypothetical protein
MVGVPAMGPSIVSGGGCALQTEKNAVTAANTGNADFIVNTCRLLQQNYAKAAPRGSASCLLDFIKNAAPGQSIFVLNTGFGILKSGVDDSPRQARERRARAMPTKSLGGFRPGAAPGRSTKNPIQCR